MSWEVMLKAIAVVIPSWTTALVFFAVAAEGTFVLKRLASSLAALLAKARYLEGPKEGSPPERRIRTE